MIESIYHHDKKALLQTKPLKVVIQGVPGAFHDLAARAYHGAQGIELVPAHSFPALFDLLENNKADRALMAIENTIAGSIIANYNLMQKAPVQAIGEVSMRIEQNLMALKGQKIEDLTEVHSHPMAILQCLDFFEKHPHIRLVESEDTALSAERIAQKKLEGVGAIASSLAAEIHNLDILAPQIETNKENYTRFLVLEKKGAHAFQESAQKVLVGFALSHEVGSLHKILGNLAEFDVNLTKIQSVPLVGSPWEYFFFLDFLVNPSIGWKKPLEILEANTNDLKIFGVY